jgi:uncharacterized LabA/DUF88 family protein
MKELAKFGIFYDANYFYHIYKYYQLYHKRQQKINFFGFHALLIRILSKEFNVDRRICTLTELHWFKGLPSTSTASDNALYYDRSFDVFLLSNGFKLHYLPLWEGLDESKEKGIDVLYALETYEIALHKSMNVVILVTGDGDFISLVYKLNQLGVRTVLTSWNIEYTENNKIFKILTSKKLSQMAYYNLNMNELIDNPDSQHKTYIDNFFYTK